VNAAIAWTLCLFIFQGGQDADTDLARARDEIKKAAAAVAATESKLVAAYRQFERFVEQCKNRPAQAPIAEAVGRAVESIRRDVAEGRLSADPAQRAKVQQELKQSCTKELESALPGGIHVAVAARMSAQLFNVAVSNGDARESIEKASTDMAHRWFDPTAPAHELWNRDLFKEVPQAREYADARAAHAAATERADRIEHPEKYHPAYANTPDGMVFVMGGTYMLGPNEGYDIDTPRRKSAFPVQLKPFYMDKTEVTNRQYYDFMKTLPKAEAAQRAPQTFEKQKDNSWKIPDGKDSHPVVGISYEDACAYAAWARKRLPTEDEWEAAARGQKGLYYPYGGSYESRRANDANADAAGTVPVGSYPGDTSPFGALDMSGNVMEWTATLEGGKPAPLRIDGNMSIVIRGGAYDRNPRQCSAVYRWVWSATTKTGNLGFRCAKDAF
jgi:formylglycine-generating enzyme required for sulfatase activity